MKEEWLLNGAVVPVDAVTTAALVAEIRRLIDVVGGMALAQRTWVGLTDEDFQPMVHKAMVYYGYKPEHLTLTSGAGFCVLVRAIEAKLKEKNT